MGLLDRIGGFLGGFLGNAPSTGHGDTCTECHSSPEHDGAHPHSGDSSGGTPGGDDPDGDVDERSRTA